MDIEKLIEEQKKTNEILLRMEKEGTLEKFFRGYDAEDRVDELNIYNVNPWKYEDSRKVIQSVMSRCFLEMGKAIGKIKFLMSAQKRFYDFHIREWMDCRENFRGSKKEDAWIDMYSNPDCIKFFDDYEREHGIKWSIAQEAKKIRKGEKSDG